MPGESTAQSSGDDIWAQSQRVSREAERKLKIFTLEERRHQLDMLQTFKILSGKERVDSTSWFVMARGSERVTSLASGTMNIRQQAQRLDI